MHAVDWTAAACFLGLIGAWLAFAFVFYFRTKLPEAPERKRDRASYWGMGLEAIAYWSVWISPRPFFSTIVPIPKIAEIAMAVLTIARRVPAFIPGIY
jgi:hypothetical protein